MYKTQVKESTYLNRRSTIQKHFSYFYKMTVDEIKPSNVQNWRLELAKEFNRNYILPRALEKPAGLAGVHRIKIHALRHSHASLLISMGENPLLIKERLGHEKIQTTLGTYGHLYPNTNMEVAKKLTGVLTYTRQQPVLPITPATSIHQSITEQLNKKCNQNAILKERAAKPLNIKALQLCSNYSHSIVAVGFGL